MVVSKSKTRVAIEQFEDSLPYFNFINSWRSPETKKIYSCNLFTFVKYCHLPSVGALMSLTPDEIRDKIIRFSLENKSISSSTQKGRLSAIKHFCEMNDVILNWKKINKFALNSSAQTPRNSDRGYTTKKLRTLSTMRITVLPHSS
ncbi:MAG: hypothetical protein ABJB85_03025 [Nitrososphaerota archaeon]